MPSGAKRRRAAKKKEKKAATAIIPNGNGEVKVIESDGGENSSPASQDLETQQNPFTKDEDREPSVGSESGEDEKMMNQDGDVVEIVVEALLENANDGCDIKKSTNGSLSRDDDEEEEEVGSQVVAVEVKLQKGEKEESELVAVQESSAEVASHFKDAVHVAPLVEVELVADQESSAEVTSHLKDAVHVAPLVESELVADQESSAEVTRLVKDAVHVPPVVESELDAVVMEKVFHKPESVLIEKSVGTGVTKSNSKKYEEKAHPSETFSDLKAESPSLPDANFTETSMELFVNQLPQSNTRIGNGELHAGSSDNHQCPEKEPLLLPAPGPANKTSWTSCCGLFELFTGLSR